MSHVFISYSQKNGEYARKLADKLLVEGFDVWIDDRIDYGDDWWRTIVRAIRKAKAFIAIMTDESNGSEWVQREVTLADKHKIPAFPVWLDGDFHASENWAIYVRTQYLDVRGGRLPEEGFYNQLAQHALRKVTYGSEVAETRPLPTTQLAKKLTLHEAMVIILREKGNQWTHTKDLADELNLRSLYTKKDGSKITQFQVHGRTKNYPHLFEKDGQLVRLKG